MEKLRKSTDTLKVKKATHKTTWQSVDSCNLDWIEESELSKKIGTKPHRLPFNGKEFIGGGGKPMLRKELSLGRVAQSVVFKDSKERLSFMSEEAHLEGKLKQIA
jgi:hypothetical protein